jgi:hypothetical protein
MFQTSKFLTFSTSMARFISFYLMFKFVNTLHWLSTCVNKYENLCDEFLNFLWQSIHSFGMGASVQSPLCISIQSKHKVIHE